MTAKRPLSNDSNQGADDVERNTTTTRQDHDKTKGSNREEDCEYGDEGFESDAGVSADRGAGDGGGAGVGDRAGDNVGGHVKGGNSSFLAKKPNRDGDFFQVQSCYDTKMNGPFSSLLRLRPLLGCRRKGLVMLWSRCRLHTSRKWCEFTGGTRVAPSPTTAACVYCSKLMITFGTAVPELVMQLFHANACLSYWISK